MLRLLLPLLIFISVLAETLFADIIITPDITVEGRKIEEKLSAELEEYGHQTRIIEGLDIEEKGFADTSEALSNLAPEMYLKINGRGDYASYYMFGSKNILWLMDGVRLNNRLYGSPYIDTLSINMIERIEILYGGESLFYGTNASSGVINIITKKPTERTSGQLGISLGNYGFKAVNGYISGSINENRFMLFASHDGWDGYKPFKKSTYELYGNLPGKKRKYSRNNIGLNYAREFDLSGYNQLEMLIQQNKGDFDYPYVNFRNAVNERTEYIGSLKWDHDITPNYSYYIKGYYHSWWTKYTRVNLDGSYANRNDIWGYEDWGLNFLNSYKFDRGDEILFGADYQNYWAKDAVRRIKEKHESVWAGFAQIRPYISFWPEWKLALGARYNKMNKSGKDSTTWNISSKMPFIGEKLYLKVNAGSSFTLPTAEQLWLDMNGEKGNPNLKPQESDSINAAIGSKWEKAEVEITGFYENTRKLIQMENNIYQNVNGKTKIYGYTVSTAVKPFDELTFKATFTKQQAKNDDKIFKRVNIPEEYASISVHYDSTIMELPAGISVFNKYTGNTFGNADNIADSKYGNYWLTDVSAYIYPSHSGRISLQVTNVFNKRYFIGIKRKEEIYHESLLGSPLTTVISYTYSF